MKTIIKKFFVLAIMTQMAVSSTGTVFAQSYDDFGGSYFDDTSASPSYDTTGGTYFNDSTQYSSGNGYSYTNYDPSTPVSYNDFGNTNFQDASTYYGSTNCVGCSSPTGNGYSYTNYDPSTPVSYNDFGNTNFQDASTYYGSTNCVGCDTGYAPSYVAPTYTQPTYTSPVYDTPSYVSPTYTSPTYTSPVYTSPSYVSPSYTSPYAYPSYGSTPTYTNPVYTYPSNNTTIPVTTTTRCSDGSYPSPTTGCTHLTTIPVVSNTVCADGYAPTNGSCIRTNTIPVTTNTICADGSTPTYLGCTRTNTIPVTTTTRCSDGSYPSPTTGCNRVIIAPVTTTQQCWDGSVIPLTSMCAAQYKTCPTGTSVPVNQICPVSNTYIPYTPAPVVKFNNVITSVATQITTTSARCNGIGLIASGANSTGWFEYGETSNLGRETGKANIGSSPTSPFSNVLTNLKPSTTYYCRAVMQNQYGTVKGEIVAFTTKAHAVVYVKPVVKTTTTVTKTVAKKNEVLCVDGSVATVTSKTAAQLINAGQKLVTLQIEKVSGSIAPGSVVVYKLTVKNVSQEALTGVTVKVTIPQEIVLTNASNGNYDPSTHTLTITNLSLPAYGEATINWTGTVDKNAPLGNSTVTTAYSSYSVPGSNAQDEVTAYVVGSVVPATTVSGDTGSKTVIGGASTGGFLPNSLVEWLALIAIIFIIFILARSVYTSYKGDKKGSH